MGTNGWQGSAQFIEDNARQSYARSAPSSTSYATGYGSFPTDQIIGQGTVDEKIESNYRDAQNLLATSGQYVGEQDRSFLASVIDNTGIDSALGGIGKAIEFISRPVSMVNLGLQETMPSGFGPLMWMGPAGMALWKRNNDWADFFKTGEEHAVEAGLSEGINAGDYWSLLQGHRTELVESVGETLAGSDGWVGGTNILEAGGLTVESLDSLPEGVRQLARAHRFGGAVSMEITNDPLTYMSFGTGGMGRKVAEETAAVSISDGARLARTTLIETGESASAAARSQLTGLEGKFFDDALERITAKTKAGQWADDMTWNQKVDDVMDFRTTLEFPDEEMNLLRSVAIKNEDDMFFGPGSRVSEAVDDVVHQIEIRNYGRGVADDTWWGSYKEHAKAGKAPLWTTGGIRVGPPALTPNQRGAQWTIPGTQGMFRSGARTVGKPLKWAMSKEGVSDSSWLREMADMWEKTVRPRLASSKPLRAKARAGRGYYDLMTIEEAVPTAAINSLGDKTLNEDLFTAIGWWGKTKRAISEGVAPAERDEMLAAVLEGVSAGTKVTPPPGASAKQVELMDEFVGEFSNIFERMGEVAATVDPSGIGKVAGKGKNYRPFVEMTKFTRTMRSIASVYGDEIGGSVNLQTVAGRDMYAKQLTETLKQSGSEDVISRADLELWLQQLGANESAPRVIHAVGMTEQMRYRRAGRSTVLVPVTDEAGEAIGDVEKATFVSLTHLNDSLVKTTTAVLDHHDLPLKFKTDKTITGKGATKIDQALELDPGKQIATWMVDMSGVITDRARMAEGIRAGMVRRGVSPVNETLLRANLVESGLLDEIKDTAIGTQVAIATRIEMAAAGPETVAYTVGGVVMHPPKKMAQDPAWIHMAESIDTISGELDATMTEFPRQYESAVADLIAQGEDGTSARAIAFNSLAYKHGEAQETFVSAVSDILQRYLDEAVHANISAGDNFAEAIERAKRMTATKREMLQADLNKLTEAFAAKYEAGLSEVKAGSFNLFDSDKGGKLSGRAASQRVEQMGKAAKDTAEGARATQLEAVGADEVMARHTAEVKELLANWVDDGADGVFNYSVDEVKYSAGFGGEESVTAVARSSDTVIAMFHPSWVKSAGRDEVAKEIVQIVTGRPGVATWSWWKANMVPLDPAASIWIPRQTTEKKLVVFMEVFGGDTANMGVDATSSLIRSVEMQSAAVRRYIGDAGTIGVVAPPSVQITAQKAVVPPSRALRSRAGVEGMTLGEFAARNGSTEALIEQANPGKIRLWHDRYGGRKSLLEEAVAEPQRSQIRRPKLTDFDNDEDFIVALRRFRDGEVEVAQVGSESLAKHTMRTYTPYWDMDPETLRLLDEQMEAMDVAISSEMSIFGDLDDLFIQLDEFGVAHGFTEDEVRILFGDWIEAHWPTVSPELQNFYRESHAYGMNDHAWTGAQSRFIEAARDNPYSNHRQFIDAKMEDVKTVNGIYDDAGQLMGRTKSRGSARNTLQSEETKQVKWIPAGTEMSVPPSRYAPGQQVRADEAFKRPKMVANEGVVAGPETRVGYESAGAAVPAVGKEEAFLPESQTLEVLENQGAAPMREATDPTMPVRDDYGTAEEYGQATAEWRRKRGTTQGQVTSIDADAYAQYPQHIATLLDRSTTIGDRAAHLASRQQAEWFDEVLSSFEPLLADEQFLLSLHAQSVTTADIVDVIARFRSSGSFVQIQESNSFKKFLAAAMDFYDEAPDDFLAAATGRVNLGNKTSSELTAMLRTAGVKGRSKATTKAQKIALLNDHYGDPAGAAVVPKGIEMPKTTTTFGKAGGVNVGRTESGGVVGKRSGMMFGNTHRRTDYAPESITKAVNDYKLDLNAEVTKSWKFREDVADLAGQDLRCPTTAVHSPCHAEVLAAKADELAKLPYEVSTEGDGRFSALNATLKGHEGKTIEHVYQVDYKGYPDWRTGKAARTGPIEGGAGFGDTKLQSQEFYDNLWRQWANENPDLMRELHELTIQRGRGLSDQFAGSSLVNQADSLERILKERFPVDLPVRDMDLPRAPVVTDDPRLAPIDAEGIDYGDVQDIAPAGDVEPEQVFEVTPDEITELAADEVFVFGSNEAGRHGKGAAKTAADKFGAEEGKGVGLAGQSYAIPTKDSELNVLPLETIEAYVKYFMGEAAQEPGTKFLVTKIGTGLAGIPEDDIAAMFRGIDVPDNVVLPDGWRGAAADIKLIDEQLPVELQPNLAGAYPPMFEEQIDNLFTGANTAHKARMAEYADTKKWWDGLPEEGRPPEPVPPVLETPTRQEAARSLVKGWELTKRLDTMIDRVGRQPQKLRVTGVEAVSPSGMQSRVTPRDTMATAEVQIEAMMKKNRELAAAGEEPLPIPDKEELANQLAAKINQGSLEADLKRQREYLMGEGSLDPGAVFEGEMSAFQEDALARNQQLIPEVEAGGFAVPPFPLSAPDGPINAVTLGVSGLAEGADTWFAQVLTDMGIPLIHHVPPEDYVKFSSRWPGVIDEGIEALPATASAAERTRQWVRSLATRTMQNVDEADMTIAFVSPIKSGQRSVGTKKTIQYAKDGKGAGYDLGWDKSWGAKHGVEPQIMEDFIEVHPGSHIYVPRKVRVGMVVVVNGDPSDEGLRILRELLKGKVNIAGPRPQLVVNPGQYKAMVEKTLKASVPGRSGVATDVAARALGPVQPAPLQGVPPARFNARIEQVDMLLDEMMVNPISKMQEMEGFVERVSVLRDGDRINRMKALIEAANEPGNMKGVREFERWYEENAEQVDALIRATYGDDHTLVVKRDGGRYVPTVEHPYAEQTARAETSKSFNELIDDVINGNLSREEALAKGLDTVIVGAEMRQSIEDSVRATLELEAAPVAGVKRDVFAQQQVIKDFDVLSKLIDAAVQTGHSKTLRAYIGTPMKDGTIRTSVAWKRISEALADEPLRLQQLERWIEAAWVADTPWTTEKAFLSWWMQERTLLSRLTYTVDQLRHQMRRRITDAYVENIWFGTDAAAEQAQTLTQRMMDELYGIPAPAAVAGGEVIDPRFTPNAEMGEMLVDRTRNRVPSKNAEAMGISLNMEDRARNVSEQLRQWSRAPEFKAADGKEFLPRGDFSTASDYYNHMADRIDDALSSQTIRERIPAPGMVTAESQGLGAGVLAGYDIDPMFAQMFEQTTANLGHLFTPYGFDQVKGATNYLTQMWKRWATVVRPSFHIRNVIGGVTNGMFGGVMPWDYMKYGPQVMKFRKGLKELTRGAFDLDVLKADGGFDGIALKYVDEDFHQIFRDAWNEGIIQTGFARTEGLRIADYSKGTANPFDPDFYLASLGGTTMESLEDVLRLTMYGKYHHQGQKKFGHSMVNMLHFDYTDLTPIEESIKKFVPFYVWTRRNVPLQLRIITSAPGFLLAIDRTRQTWNETQKQQNPERYEPYMDSSGWLLPFGREDDDGWAQLTWQPDMPFMDLDQMPLFASGEGTWPVGTSSLNPGAWMQYGVDMLGPAFSIPYSTLSQQEGGSVNAPRGIAEVMQVLDAMTNAVGAEGLVQTGHAPDGTPTDVQIPKLLDTLWHGMVPPAEDYLAMLGLAPRNPYRAADEGWLNSDDPAFWSPSNLALGWMRGVGRGAGFRFDSPRQAFFDQKETETRISDIEYNLKRGIGG